jgi:endo-1,4-beta-xylanase
LRSEHLNKYVVSRRSFTKLLGVAAIAAAKRSYSFPTLSDNYQKLSIKAAAKRIGLRYGSDSDVEFMRSTPAYRKLFVEQCDLYAAYFNWKRYFPNSSIVSPIWEDPNILFANRNNIGVTGGHLLWGNDHFLPPWLNKSDNIRDVVSSYITKMGHVYKNIYSWNVINEALNLQDGRPDGLRRTIFLHGIGEDFFNFAFTQAKIAAPNVLRVYSEYDLEFDNSYQDKRRNALIRLLDKLKKNNVPVDAIGLQSHLKLDGSRFNDEKYRKFLREISSRGYKIMITELDVFDYKTKFSSIEDRDLEVASLYSRFLSTALDEPAVISVVNWGLSDKYTWLNPNYSKVYEREDKRPSRPLPFDETLSPKPAYQAIIKAIQNAPMRISREG